MKIIAVKYVAPTTLFPLDTERGKSVRPVRQLIAIFVGIAYSVGLIISFLPKDW